MTLERTAQVPADVLVRVIDGEAVILNLASESYFGLNDVSTDFWEAIVSTSSLAAAVERLLSEFDVASEQLEPDFIAFVDDLVAAGLLELTH